MSSKSKYILLILLTCWCFISHQDVVAQITSKVTDVTCYGDRDGVIVINAPIRLNFEWTDGETAVGYSTRREALKAGTYTVVMHAAEGSEECFEALSFEVKQPKELKMKIVRRKIPGPYECFEKVPILIEVYAFGGTPPYSINGQNANPAVFRCTDTQEYTFAVRDKKGCFREKKMTILVGSRYCPMDPNDIIGPLGFDSPQWMAKKDTLPYTIRFENDPLLASAPAQHVFVTHDFDPNANPYSFRLGQFGFGDHVFDIPPHTANYQQRLDLTATDNVFVDVVAGLDVLNNRAFWSLRAIDPATGQQPVDPLVGFLPVNDTLTGSGEGFVTFSVLSAAHTTTGDSVHAQANIFFDENPVIETNIWNNVLDAIPPETILDPLPSTSADSTVLLSWSGEDDPTGSGLKEVHFFVSTDNGPFVLFDVINPDSSEYAFQGDFGHVYYFKTLGVDFTGNIEVKELADDTITILQHKEVRLTEFSDAIFCVADTLEIGWTSILIDTIDLYISIDSGETHSLIAQNLDSADTPFAWPIPDSLAESSIFLYVIAADSTEIRDSSIALFIEDLPEINAGEDVVTCIGTIHHLLPTGGTSYLWEPATPYSDPGETAHTFIADTNTIFYVMGSNVYGCVDRDTLSVYVLPTYLDSITHLMCNEDSVFAGGGYQTEPAFYTDDLISIYGCDSTVVTEVVLTGPCQFPAPQVYVDKDAVGLNNGTSWVNAFTDLQDALAVVDYYPNVREIWIAEGVYYPALTNRDSAFALTDSVAIYGGFIGNESTRAERTTNAALVQISGDIGIVNDSTDNAYHVFRADTSCVDCILDGVTIRFGQADTGLNENAIGAGVHNLGTLTIHNCIIERNTSILDGAAIYNSGTSADLLISNCTFRLNTSGLERDILNGSNAVIRFAGLNQILD